MPKHDDEIAEIEIDEEFDDEDDDEDEDDVLGDILFELQLLNYHVKKTEKWIKLIGIMILLVIIIDFLGSCTVLLS